MEEQWHPHRYRQSHDSAPTLWIEVYVPDPPSLSYRSLLETLEIEFTYTFGGCSVIRGVEGIYLSVTGTVIEGRVNLIYTDAPFSFHQHRDTIARYAAELKAAVFEGLDEETILIVAHAIFHG